MTTIHLEAGWEKVAPEKPFEKLQHKLLYHQTRTLEALKVHDLVINSYNTGTGKTVASLLYLFELDRQHKQGKEQQNVLFIAPTNALIGQHTQDIEQFVDDYQLDFKVLKATARDIRGLEKDVKLRPGEMLYRLLRNYREFDPESTRRQPIILVTNPDIFYYALYFRYGAHDRRNVFSEFVRRFNYIVVDEFHYYDQKQLANFLFAFTLFDELGYFEVTDRKVCLLSATPNEQVREYLRRLFDDSRWVEISPDNEPAESATYQTIQTLTSLTLTIEDGDIRSWVETHRDTLKNDAPDGAIISSSLAQINEAYNLLTREIAETDMGRITGPEKEEDRIAATARRLILATPTVDIGYNFVKHHKLRQNVDFVVFDARFRDEVIQRMGRAGRVLGKSDTAHSSRATALLSKEAAGLLLQYDGQTLSRTEFKRIITNNKHLPEKHTLVNYIRSYAITESFWPIFQFEKMISPDEQEHADNLLNRVKEVFDPNNKQSQKSLRAYFYKLQARKKWLKATEKQPEREADDRDAKHIVDWLYWLRVYNTDEQDVWLDELDWNGIAELRKFVQSQVGITEALFSFRDSFQGPTAVFYDRRRLLSSQTVNSYDLFHLLANYKLSPPISPQKFKQTYETNGLAGSFYFELKGFRETKLNIVLSYQTEDDAETFEKKWCNAPVALSDIRLLVEERYGDLVAGGLDPEITTALAGKPLPMLIIPPDSRGALFATLRGTNLRWYRFVLNHSKDEYYALLGKAAFNGYAELKRHFFIKAYKKEKMKPDFIII